jgi:type IV secretory pathway component VirB8
MEPELIEKFKKQDEKLEKIYVSVEKTRRYFLWTFIVTIVAFVLPVIGLIVIIPWFLKIMSEMYSGLGI